MPLPIDSELVKRVCARIDDEDNKAIEKMAGGMLRDFSEYRFSAGYRKALRDAKTILNETFEDLMKE